MNFGFWINLSDFGFNPTEVRMKLLLASEYRSWCPLVFGMPPEQDRDIFISTDLFGALY